MITERRLARTNQKSEGKGRAAMFRVTARDLGLGVLAAQILLLFAILPASVGSASFVERAATILFLVCALSFFVAQVCGSLLASIRESGAGGFATLAILGNLHLAAVVGAVFTAIPTRPR